MLKKGIRLLICVVLAFCCLTACRKLPTRVDDTQPTQTEESVIAHQTQETTLPEETTRETEQSATQETTLPEETTRGTEQPVPQETMPSTEYTQPTVSSDWKVAYLEYIELNKGWNIEYALVHIDGDEIPELYLSGDCEATGDTVCSYKNGTVIEQRLGRKHGGSYIEGSGKLINRNGNMGCCYTNAYTLTDTGFNLIFSADMIERVVQLENNEHQLTYEYSIEGIPVSETEHNAAIAAVFDYAQAQWLHENAVSYDEIKQQIQAII